MRSSSDVVSNYRLITWRVVDSGPGFKVSGFSATGVLDYLHSADSYDYDHDHDYEGEDSDHDHDEFNGSYDHEMASHGVEIEEIDGCDDAIDAAIDVVDSIDDDDDDDKMGFCEVGFVWEAVEGDESWCLVEEI